MNTYDLLQSAHSLVVAIEGDEGIDPTMLAPRLAAWLDASDDKLGGCRVAIARLTEGADFLKSEEKRIAERRKAIEAQTAHVRDLATSLLVAREALGEEPKVKTPTYTAWLQASESVDGPERPEDWPTEYQRVTVSADREAAKRALKAGTAIEGVTLRESRSVRFR